METESDKGQAIANEVELQMWLIVLTTITTTCYPIGDFLSRVISGYVAISTIAWSNQARHLINQLTGPTRQDSMSAKSRYILFARALVFGRLTPIVLIWTVSILLDAH